MNFLLTEIRDSRLLWLLVFVPLVLAGEHLWPERHTLLFLLSVLAIVPLAAMLSRATELVAERTGDAVGGLLNATLGNLTELVIALTALQAGQYLLVKASIAGAIVTNTLFMLGGSFLIGGLRHHEQQFNRVSARLQSSLLFLATVGLLVPSLVALADGREAVTQSLSVGLAVLLMIAYALSMVFSLRTHKEAFVSVAHGEAHETPWPLGVALIILAGVTVLVALVSHVFVSSVQQAAETLGMSPAFVGFIVVAIVGAAAEIATAFSAAAKNRLDLSVGIALGSAAQIALFVAPLLVFLSYVIGPEPMSLQFWPGAIGMMLIATMGTTLIDQWRPFRLVRRRHDPHGVCDFRADALPASARRMTPEHPPAGGLDEAQPSLPAPSRGVLDPVSRASEILFGLIMVLTFTLSLTATEAGRADVLAVLVGMLGCNLAWAIIDAVMYLMGVAGERRLGITTLQAIRDAESPAAGRAIVANNLPPPILPALTASDLERIRLHLGSLRPRALRRDSAGKTIWPPLASSCSSFYACFRSLCRSSSSTMSGSL